MTIFSNRSAVVIASDRKVQGILTKIDILDFLSTQVS
jgi:predicted transcriptional regulator